MANIAREARISKRNQQNMYGVLRPKAADISQRHQQHAKESIDLRHPDLYKDDNYVLAVMVDVLPPEVTMLILESLIETHSPIVELQPRDPDSAAGVRRSLLGDSQLSQQLQSMFFEALFKICTIRINGMHCRELDIINLIATAPHPIWDLVIYYDVGAECCIMARVRGLSITIHQLMALHAADRDPGQLLQAHAICTSVNNYKPTAASLQYLRSLTICLNVDVKCCQVHLPTTSWLNNAYWSTNGIYASSFVPPSSVIVELIRGLQCFPKSTRKVLQVIAVKSCQRRIIVKEVKLDCGKDFKDVVQEFRQQLL